MIVNSTGTLSLPLYLRPIFLIAGRPPNPQRERGDNPEQPEFGDPARDEGPRGGLHLLSHQRPRRRQE